jgi:hypothetical protein
VREIMQVRELKSFANCFCVCEKCFGVDMISLSFVVLMSLFLFVTVAVEGQRTKSFFACFCSSVSCTDGNLSCVVC